MSGLSTAFIRFLERYSCEHQDEGNFRVHLRVVDKEQQLTIAKQKLINHQMTCYQMVLQELFEYLGMLTHREGEEMDKHRERMEFKNEY